MKKWFFKKRDCVEIYMTEKVIMQEKRERARARERQWQRSTDW